jgi:plastocyanin
VPHTETCSGPCQASITFNSGPPGSYTFQCSIHADMVGMFTVQ